MCDIAARRRRTQMARLVGIRLLFVYGHQTVRLPSRRTFLLAIERKIQIEPIARRRRVADVGMKNNMMLLLLLLLLLLGWTLILVELRML